MNVGRRARWHNPVAWYSALGACLLLFSLYIPWLSASRTTRIETRAADLAEALLAAAVGFAPPFTEADCRAVLARLFLTADSHGIYTRDLERVEPPPPGAILCLRNKHYAFQLTESPPDPSQRVGRGTVPALEVTAWPLRAVGPGHCAFFVPENAARAYTRNLRRGYAGFGEGQRPLPGAAHRRLGLGGRRPSQYPGNDDERWLLY